MSNEGKKVKAHYRGTLDDGTQFDCSYDRNEPIEFTCMAVGEKKTVKIPAADAYGEYNPQAVQEVPVSKVPNADQLPVGQTVYFQGPMGPFPAKVVSVDSEKCVFDMNHELAGKDLTFEIELVEVAE